MFKKRTVVMLPTNQISKIKLGFNNKLDFSPAMMMINEKSWVNQHLYITSDEEIKANDWIYSKLDDSLLQWDGDLSATKNPGEYGYKKVIVSTDPKLIINIGGDTLPQPSQAFITKYIEEYNKGNIITEVMVEYKVKSTIPFSEMCPERDRAYIEVLKIDSKDNTITIKRVKDSWTRDEVEHLLFSLAEYYAMTSTKEEIENFNKWVNNNL